MGTVSTGAGEGGVTSAVGASVVVTSGTTGAVSTIGTGSLGYVTTGVVS